MNKIRLTIAFSSLLLGMILISVGTVAYFLRGINGNITGQVGNLVLIVNDIDATFNDEFDIVLKRSSDEHFILPDDSGKFDINIDSSGSSTDVAVIISLSRTNLPDNLRFYLDEEHKQEFIINSLLLKKADSMKKTVTVYWYWDGSIDDANDTSFMGKNITANITVSATPSRTLYSALALQNSILDTNIDFSSNTYENQGLMMRSGTENDDNPILYYRGAVTNNNVIFADLCWLIVRTTETGGVKLVYNGKINDDGSCTNFSGVGGETANINSLDESLTDTLVYAESGSPVYAGYMYNDNDTFFDTDLDVSGYIGYLANNLVDQVTGRHIQNLNDSPFKVKIDSWYEEKIKDTVFEDLLEDTVWCNDRSVSSENYTIGNYASNSNVFHFSAYTRIRGGSEVLPTLLCERDIDKFTVEKTHGNGDLTYPVGMLTADEITFAGRDNAYLSNSRFWTLSPGIFKGGNIQILRFIDSNVTGNIAGWLPIIGIRPSVSLKNSTVFAAGDGSFSKPFVISN